MKTVNITPPLRGVFLDEPEMPLGLQMNETFARWLYDILHGCKHGEQPHWKLQSVASLYLNVLDQMLKRFNPGLTKQKTENRKHEKRKKFN